MQIVWTVPEWTSDVVFFCSAPSSRPAFICAWSYQAVHVIDKLLLFQRELVFTVCTIFLALRTPYIISSCLYMFVYKQRFCNRYLSKPLSQQSKQSNTIFSVLNLPAGCPLMRTVYWLARPGKKINKIMSWCKVLHSRIQFGHLCVFYHPDWLCAV